MQKSDTNLVAVVTAAYCDVADAASPGVERALPAARLLGRKFQPASLPPECSLANYLIRLCLSFLISKKEDYSSTHVM